MLTIVLDPGHGGHDPGAIGPTGLREADVVLDLAKRIREQLSDTGLVVLLTREDDVFLTPTERATFANEKGADLFISIHCNAAKDPSAHGTETWYFKGSIEGRRLAEFVHTQLQARLGRKNRGLKSSSMLTVLKRTIMPAVLIEPMFLSNDIEETLYRQPEIKNVLAKAIADGILAYAFDKRRNRGR